MVAVVKTDDFLLLPAYYVQVLAGYVGNIYVAEVMVKGGRYEAPLLFLPFAQNVLVHVVLPSEAASGGCRKQRRFQAP